MIYYIWVMIMDSRYKFSEKEIDGIEQARKESELQFRNEVSAFALEIAEKMVRKDMANDKAQTELVDKLLNEVETKN